MFLERFFYYKPIKTKHITITNRGNTEKLMVKMVKFPCLVCKKPVARNHSAVCLRNVTVGYKFIVIIFANKLLDNHKRPQVLGTVNLV